jgi:enamine deaminase RidA (YjgF/YER057c/UK114 family)
MIMQKICALAALFACAPLLAQTPPPAQQPASTPMHIPTRSGEVILPTAVDKQNYDEYGFAAVRRAGNLLFISGVVVGRRADEGNDAEAFKVQVRRGFRRLETILKAADLSFDDIVMINSFHLWDSPNFAGTKAEQFKAFEQVKEEFMTGPKPAWTAVGSTGLLPDNGIVEIQMIAALPERTPRKL